MGHQTRRSFRPRARGTPGPPLNQTAARESPISDDEQKGGRPETFHAKTQISQGFTPGYGSCWV